MKRLKKIRKPIKNRKDLIAIAVAIVILVEYLLDSKLNVVEDTICINIFYKLSAVIMIILSIIVVHILKNVIKKWFEDYVYLLLIIECTIMLPIIVHKLFYANNYSLNEADLLSFYGTYLTFVGALCLGYFLYKREKKNIYEAGRMEAAFLEKGMEKILVELMYIECYAKNGKLLPTIPQWKMYYKSVSNLVMYNEADFYTELSHFFETICLLNDAIEKRNIEKVRKIYKEFCKYEEFECGAYNYIEAQNALKLISNGIPTQKTWISVEEDKIYNLEEEYFEIVNLWICNYMLKNRVVSCNLDDIEEKLVEWLLTSPQMKYWVQNECDKRKIVVVIKRISDNISEKSVALNYFSGVYSKKA